MKVICAAAGLLAWALVSTVSAQSGETAFSIPGHGSLVLNVPKGWRTANRSLDNPPSAAIRIGPHSGDAFLLQLTSIWLDPAKLARLTPEELKARVQKSAEDMLPQAAEKQAALIELRGKDARGYHFALTDRTSKNLGDDYKYVTQGSMIAGETLTVFTLLHRDPADPARQQAVQMLADARYSTKSAAAQRPDALQVNDLGQAYELSVPVSRLVMTLPKSGMPGATRAPGLSSHPRYFYFVDGRLNVSGWFEPASEFKGMRSFWEDETQTWRKKGLPAAIDPSFQKIGGWDAVLYDTNVSKATNSHIRAHWVQAGTWIDLHLSLTSERTSAETRARLTELLRSIEVKERN